MATLDSQATQYISYMELIILELKKRNFPSREIAFPALCAFRIRASIASAKILIENDLIHDALSCLRSALETVILLVGYYRISDFKLRRRLDNLKDSKDLFSIRLEASLFSEIETEEVIRNNIDQIDSVLKENHKNGINPFANIHAVADGCNILPLKKRFYKLLCMSAHPSTKSLLKYAENSTPVVFVDYPEKDDSNYLSDLIFNVIVIMASILNEKLLLGIKKIPSVEELVETLK
jgi:hypothetical protein